MWNYISCSFGGLIVRLIMHKQNNSPLESEIILFYYLKLFFFCDNNPNSVDCIAEKISSIKFCCILLLRGTKNVDNMILYWLYRAINFFFQCQRVGPQNVKSVSCIFRKILLYSSLERTFISFSPSKKNICYYENFSVEIYSNWSKCWWNQSVSLEWNDLFHILLYKS